MSYSEIAEKLYALGNTFATDYELNYKGMPATIWTGENYHICIGSIVAYLVYIFGPGKKYMEVRKPFDLKTALGLWNFSLSLFSFMGMMRTVPKLLGNLLTFEYRDTVCIDPADEWGQGPCGFWVMLFIFSKIPELFDTVFIILRKKKLIFLHWYHHASVLLFCWNAFETRSGSGLYFVAMNYTVHFIMYLYYGLQAFNMMPRWFPPILVTIGQLSQMFVGVFVCCSAWYYRIYDSSTHCNNDKVNLILGALMYASYLYLFAEFMVKRFILSPLKQTEKEKKSN
jgi:elongation of very long chain fatty acids protein 6